jgi:CheY-like chemotaxis protein
MTILLVDDNPDERLAFIQTLRGARFHGTVQEIDGVPKALQYLQGQGPFADRCLYPLPDLIVLDLVMPGASGIDLLAWLKARPEFSGIATVVLSGYPFSGTLTSAYQLGARSFFIKPVYASELTTFLAGLRDT